MENNIISSFLLDSRFRIQRYLVLLFTIAAFTADFVWYVPDELANVYVKIAGWICYIVFFGAAISFNLKTLIPGFLLRQKMALYSALLLLTIFTTTLILLLIQKYILGIGITYHWLIGEGILTISACVVVLGLMFAGTTTIALFKQRIQYNTRINELESTTLLSELGLLKNQINPHFLFNMINNANMLLEKEGLEASEMIFKLEDLLRYQIEDCSKSKVALSSDIHFLNDFLNLEKIRRDNFEFTISKQGEINKVEISPLVFIPFVENAVKHSLDSESPSYIHILFKTDNRKLEFTCENSIPQIKSAKTGGLGLKNIKRRLELLYPQRYKLNIAEGETEFCVKLELTI